MSSVHFIKTQEAFKDALEILVEKLKEDRNVLAALLAGSLSHDSVWEKSDIDLIIICRDTKLKNGERELALTEQDINIHAWLLERSRFKKIIESSLRNSFIHSYFSKSTLLFTKDNSLHTWYEDVHKIGLRDQKSLLMSTASSFMPIISKVEKFLYSKNDPQYAFIWLSYLYPGLAKIEVALKGEIAGREVIHQAMQINPSFFTPIYTSLIDQPKTAENIAQALEQIDEYLSNKIPALFQPLLDFLSVGGRIKSMTEIETWAQQEMNIESVLGACEWLADKEIIDRTSLPLRLTPTSLTEVEELGFYYETIFH